MPYKPSSKRYKPRKSRKNPASPGSSAGTAQRYIPKSPGSSAGTAQRYIPKSPGSKAGATMTGESWEQWADRYARTQYPKHVKKNVKQRYAR